MSVCRREREKDILKEERKITRKRIERRSLRAENRERGRERSEKLWSTSLLIPMRISPSASFSTSSADAL